MAAMDWFAAIPMIVGVISNLSSYAMDAIAERLLTIMLAACIIGGVAVFAVMAFAWLSVKHAIAELHAPPSTAPH